MEQATHALTIVYNGTNPNVLRWLQKIEAQSKHPQYQGDILVGTPFRVNSLEED